MPSTDFKGGAVWPALSMADPRSIIGHQQGTRLLLPFRGYRERQVGGAFCRRLAADLPQGADLHMARTDRARTVLTMAASLHLTHRTPVMRTV